MMTVLKVENLAKHYPIKGWGKKQQSVTALKDISFEINEGEIVALVGESGCGKSTLAKVLMKLTPATSGRIELFSEHDYQDEKTPRSTDIQMVFQDPYFSLNPRKKLWELIADPLLIQKKASKEDAKIRALELMERVGLRTNMADRYPHMISGGQRQRIGIARALILEPRVLICDEPISALDVSIQSQIINLLLELRQQFSLTLLFITHDLTVVRYLAEKVIVMYLGEIVEWGDKEALFNNPSHPYTKALLEASPSIFGQKKHSPLTGELPSPVNPPSGCAFHPRCPIAQESCRQKRPLLREGDDKRLIRCDLV